MKLSPTVPWKCYLPKEAVISESMAGRIQGTGICWMLLFKIGVGGAILGLHCSTGDLCCNIVGYFLLWRVGSVAPGHMGILVPRSGIEPESPALEGGFLTTKEVPCWLLPDKMKMNPDGHEPGCMARTKTRQ